MILQGTYIIAGNKRQIKNGKFVRDFFIDNGNDKYPSTPKLQLYGDKVDLVGVLEKGDEVKCHIDIKGIRYKRKDGTEDIFNAVQCWKIEKLDFETSEDPIGDAVTEGLPF